MKLARRLTWFMAAMAFRIPVVSLPALADCTPASIDPSCPLSILNPSNPANLQSIDNPNNPNSPLNFGNPANPASPLNPLNPANPEYQRRQQAEMLARQREADMYAEPDAPPRPKTRHHHRHKLAR